MKKTVTIELLDDRAIKLLMHFERLKLIKLQHNEGLENEDERVDNNQKCNGSMLVADGSILDDYYNSVQNCSGWYL